MQSYQSNPTRRQSGALGTAKSVTLGTFAVATLAAGGIGVHLYDAAQAAASGQSVQSSQTQQAPSQQDQSGQAPSQQDQSGQAPSQQDNGMGAGGTAQNQTGGQVGPAGGMSQTQSGGSH